MEVIDIGAVRRTGSTGSNGSNGSHHGSIGRGIGLGSGSGISSGSSSAAPAGFDLGNALPLLLAGVDSLGHGLAILAGDGTVLWANAAARTRLEPLARLPAAPPAIRPTPSQPGNDTPTADTRGSPQRWLDALLRVCLRGRRELVELPAPGTTQGGGFAALVPITADGRRCAFAIFGRDDLCGAVELELFALRHGLTATESEVLRKLCRGLRAAEIAKAHGVTLATVLTHITAIRTKTLCRSVRQLLHALSRMPQLRAAA